MYIDATQFAILLEEIQERYSASGRDLDSAEEIQEILLRDYPQIQGVTPPPAYQQIRRDYLPEDWDMEIPQERPMRSRRGPTISAGSPRDAYASSRPPRDPRLQIQADLNLLRSNPMGTMTYLIHRARGIESERAMRWAHLSGRLYDLMLITQARRVSRAVSGETGQPGSDYYHQRAVSSARADMAMRALPTVRPPTTRRAPRPGRLRPVETAPAPGYPARSAATHTAARPPQYRFRQRVPPSQVRDGLRRLGRRPAR